MFYRLPTDIINEIYEFDRTYHEIYKNCLKELKKVEKKYKVRFSIENNEFMQLQFSENKIWNFTKNIKWQKRTHHIYSLFVYYNIYSNFIWDINPIVSSYIDFKCSCFSCNKTYIDYLKIKLLK